MKEFDFQKPKNAIFLTTWVLAAALLEAVVELLELHAARDMAATAASATTNFLLFVMYLSFSIASYIELYPRLRSRNRKCYV